MELNVSTAIHSITWWTWFSIQVIFTLKSCFVCLSELWIIPLVKADIYDENTCDI